MKESNVKIIKIKEGKPEWTETRKKKEKKKNENSLKNISLLKSELKLKSKAILLYGCKFWHSTKRCIKNLLVSNIR